MERSALEARNAKRCSWEAANELVCIRWVLCSMINRKGTEDWGAGETEGGLSLPYLPVILGQLPLHPRSPCFCLG